MIATFRVAFVRATFRRGRGEWRVSLRSTRPGMSKTPDYQAFFLAEDDERLDETITSFNLGGVLHDDDLLDVDLEWVPRLTSDGEARPRQYIRALRLVPIEAQHLSPEDVVTVLAEARAVNVRFPDHSHADRVETVVDLLDVIVPGATLSAVKALMETNP
jgi:hypothetical protein